VAKRDGGVKSEGRLQASAATISVERAQRAGLGLCIGAIIAAKDGFVNTN